jgi:hypothetical protein
MDEHPGKNSPEKRDDEFIRLHDVKVGRAGAQDKFVFIQVAEIWFIRQKSTCLNYPSIALLYRIHKRGNRLEYPDNMPDRKTM